ncbi:hypothetical protein [Mycoplasma todarodis]|uniref:hypothetical protein n=1 Tax=Mycoplasma todarodis TaxID=1937191 RepID=UPI003B2F1431
MSKKRNRIRKRNQNKIKRSKTKEVTQEIKGKMEYVFKVAEEWRYKNNDKPIIDMKQKYITYLSDVVIFCNKLEWTSNKDFILKTQQIIVMTFLEMNAHLNFSHIGLSNLELELCWHFFAIKGMYGKWMEFVKKYGRQLYGIQNGHDNIFFLGMVMNFHFEWSRMEYKLKKVESIQIKKQESIKFLQENLSRINEINIGADSSYWRGKLKLLLLNVFSYKATWTFIKENILRFKKDFMEIKEMINLIEVKEGYSVLSRLFWWIIKKELKNFNSNTMLVHYTKIENLYAMLETKSLKFTELNNLNDEDENRLLNNISKNKIFSLSFSNKKDSLDLFGNYTEMEGIAIVFKSQKTIEKLRHISFRDQQNISVIPLGIGSIEYNNEPQKIINAIRSEIELSFNGIIPLNFILDGLNEAETLLNYFFKREPWAYEAETRFTIDIPHYILESQLLSGKYNKNKSSLFLDFDISDGIIEKIIIGPQIKRNPFKLKMLKDLLEKYSIPKEIIENTMANYKA